MKTFRTKAAVSLIMAAAGLVMASCQKDDNLNPRQPEEKVTIKVNVTGEPMTRASLNVLNEQMVNSVEVFVFNDDDNAKLDSYGKIAGGTELSLNCTAGQKIIYAVVNNKMTSTQLNAITNLSGFLETTTQLKSNTLDSFEMIGLTRENVTSGSSISIIVSRIVARVGIGTIKTDFLSPYLKNASFKIKRIYMLNAVAKTNYGLDKELTTEDFACLKSYSGEMTALLSTDLDLTMRNKTSQAVNQYFYVFPNSVQEDVFDMSDDPRKTRLVVEAEIDGVKSYYPITIEGEDGTLKSNKAYTINNLTITREGSASPDSPLEINEGMFSLSVAEWDETSSDKNI